jgi:hypothetical protein
VKAMIVALVKVGNVIKVGNANTTIIVYVARSYFVGIVLRSSIKVNIDLFEFLFSQTINFLRFEYFSISSFFLNKI